MSDEIMHKLAEAKSLGRMAEAIENMQREREREYEENREFRKAVYAALERFNHTTSLAQSHATTISLHATTIEGHAKKIERFDRFRYHFLAAWTVFITGVTFLSTEVAKRLFGG